MRNSLPIEMFDWPFSYGLTQHFTNMHNTKLIPILKRKLGKPTRIEQGRCGRKFSVWEFDAWRCRANNERGVDVEVFVDNNDSPVVDIAAVLDVIEQTFGYRHASAPGSPWGIQTCPYDEMSSKFGPFRAVK